MVFTKNRFKKLAGLIKENNFGSDDSVDGAYTEVSDLQPMNQNPKDLLEKEHDLENEESSCECEHQPELKQNDELSLDNLFGSSEDINSIVDDEEYGKYARMSDAYDEYEI